MVCERRTGNRIRTECGKFLAKNSHYNPKMKHDTGAFLGRVSDLVLIIACLNSRILRDASMSDWLTLVMWRHTALPNIFRDRQEAWAFDFDQYLFMPLTIPTEVNLLLIGQVLRRSRNARRYFLLCPVIYIGYLSQYALIPSWCIANHIDARSLR